MQESIPLESTLFTLQSNNRTWSFYRPADQEQVLRNISAKEYKKDRFAPFWAEHWPSSEVLFSYCVDILPKKFHSICEIGCGLGVIATALKAQEHPVIATDISSYACKYAAANMIKYSISEKCVVCCDWRYTPFKQQFDLIIASDILYEERWIKPVLSFLKENLLENGIALIADPTRNYWETFKKQAGENGFKTEVIHEQIVNEGKTIVEILKIRKYLKR